MKNFSVFVIAVVMLVMSGCKDSGLSVKPNVSGKAGEVVVVIEKEIWETEVGNEIRSVLASDYPYLPQKEASFNLINVRKNSFNSLLKSHRNVMIVNVDHEITNSQIKILSDQWAAPQTVITLNANSKAEAIKLLEEKGELVYNALEQGERNRIIRNSKKYEEKQLRELVANVFGGSPYFPNGYSLKKQTDNFIWISYETTKTNQGILIFNLPYTDSTSLSYQSLTEGINDALRLNVPAMMDDSYMTIGNGISPELSWIKYKGYTFEEMRGLWDVKNDFMGGPFVAHIFYNEQQKNLLVLYGFVYAPARDKRGLLRQVESFIYSFEWNNK